MTSPLTEQERAEALVEDARTADRSQMTRGDMSLTIDALLQRITDLTRERDAAAYMAKEWPDIVIGLRAQLAACREALGVADQLAEWARVTVSVEGVFSNNLGAQAQAQGLANLVTRYAAHRALSDGESETWPDGDQVGHETC